MPRKKRTRNSTYYDQYYDSEEFHTMKRYGSGDLYNEVELLRALMYRALGKMNDDLKKLTFQDHLAALNAFSRTSGRVAYLMEVQQRLFPPQEEFNQMIRNFNNKLAESIEKDIASLEEKGEQVPDWLMEIQAKNLQRLFRGER